MTDFYCSFPYIVIENNVIVDANNLFSELTDFDRFDILNTSLMQLWNDLLHINVKLELLENEAEAFLFTKFLQVRLVKISIMSIPCTSKQLYSFEPLQCETLSKQYPFLENLYANTDYGLAIYSVPDFILINANQQYLDATEKIRENTIGRSIFGFVANFENSHSCEIWKGVCKTGTAFYDKEYHFRGSWGKSDTYWNYSVSPIIVDSKVKYLITIIRNLTETLNYKISLQDQASTIQKQIIQLKSVVDTIKKQQEELEALMHNMSDAIFIFDETDNYILRNKAAYELFPAMERLGDGYSVSTFLDMNGNIIPFEEMAVSLIRRGIHVRNRKITLIQGEAVHYLSVSGTPIMDETGRFRLGIMSCRDVTNSVIIEKELRDSQDQILKSEIEKNEILEKTLKMKDEFLSLISHEFKTPLTVIFSAIQAIELLYKDKLPARVSFFIDSIKQNTYRQIRLVNNLLDVTRANAGHLKTIKRNMDIVFLTKSITDSVELYALQKEIDLVFIPEIPEKTIGIDDEKYERVLLNLLSNAIKYTPKGKSINIKLSLDQEKDMICVQVTDTGIGIPDDKQELIFERFGQVDSDLSRQAEGSGIGLSLIKLFLNAMGGSIELQSEVGKGSTFSVFLPAVQTEKSDPVHINTEESTSRLVQAIAIEFSDIYL